ncbi:hypothetical protein O7622_26385 [Micromonospora sp. WMMD1076]|uniref:hypothetical protein n=1 Tax=Micromonospora sp. WMMD1076 TaxID=3016103 RepID=UPI00249CCC5D|nr:hypothetical protein [Micromonospora sp. WMMD1076]WFF06534.1 hypothetical protein O7622_26385 [Micromonospora sp. WMMD1076]
MPEEDLDRLLAVTAKIAEAVQAFPPEVRQAAYDDMMAAYKGAPSRPAAVPKPSPAPDVELESSEPDSVDDDVEPTSNGRARKTITASSATKASPRKAKAKAKPVTPVRDFNFWPPNKQAFPDFVQEKKPTNFDEKNLVAVYWLEQIAEAEAIGTGHVLAAYKAVRWREASNPENSLQSTASRTRWLDTGDMKAIRTTHGGRVAVEHDMPIVKEPAAKKSKR